MIESRFVGIKTQHLTKADLINVKCAVVPSAGDCWYHIPSPAKQKLKQVSVGRTSIYSVDENGKATAVLFIPKHSKHLCFTSIPAA